MIAAAAATALLTAIGAVVAWRQRAESGGKAQPATRRAWQVVGLAAVVCAAAAIRLAVPGAAWPAPLLMLLAAVIAGMIIRGMVPLWLEVVLDAGVVSVAGTLLIYEMLLLLRPVVSDIPSSRPYESDVVCVTIAAWLVAVSFLARRPSKVLVVLPNVLVLLAWVGLCLQAVPPIPALPELAVPIVVSLGIVSYGLLSTCMLSRGEMPEYSDEPVVSSSWRAFALSASAILLTMVALPLEPRLGRPVVYALVGLSFLVVALRQLATVRHLRQVGDHVRERERRFRSLLADSTDVIMICRDSGQIDYISPAAENVLGRDGAVEGQTVWDVLAIPENTFRMTLARLDIDGGSALLEGRRGNQILEAAISRRGRELLASIRDVTERDRLRQRLHFLAYHDPLTGLVNRSRVLARIAAMTERNERCAVLFIDLDRFKQVNDNSGHDIGDQVLKQVADRLSRLTADGDLIGRLGGDEFVAVTGADQARAEDIAAEVVAAMNEPFEVDERFYQLGASVGISVGAPGLEPDELLRRADLAMYEAKRTRRSRVVYQPSMTNAALEQANLDVAVSRAMREGTMGVYLQPLVDLASGRVVTVEALLRWHDSTGRVGSPAEMLDYARRSGRLAELTDWVLDESLRIAATSPTHVAIAVNMPPDILITPGLPAKLQRMLSRHNVDPRRLELEVTEDQLLETTSAAHAVQILRNLGVSLLIDDFGTGFSSLGYLVDVPMDGLKIDQRFTRALQTSEAARSIVAGLVGIARRLQLRVVIEGIETPDLHRWASDLGVQIGQGYWYGRPEASSAVADLSMLSSWRSSEAAPFLLPASQPVAGQGLPRQQGRGEAFRPLPLPKKDPSRTR